MIFRSIAPLVFLGACAMHAASTPANALLVLEKEQNTLVIVDPATLTIVARVPVGSDPHEVAVSDDGKTAYISNYSNGNSISVVDLVAQKAAGSHRPKARCGNCTAWNSIWQRARCTSLRRRREGMAVTILGDTEDRLGDRHRPESYSHGDGVEGSEDGIHFEREFGDH